MMENSEFGAPRVVAAVDGSPAADNALDWAADEAHLRGAALEVVHAWDETPKGHWTEGILSQQADEIVRTAAERVRRRRVGLTVTSSVLRGEPGDVLTEVGHGADLVVMGSRGRGGFVGMLLGSVSRRVASEADCPLLIVRAGEAGIAQPPQEEDYFRTSEACVVVGIADETGEAAVRTAFLEASGRRQRVHAVYAWSLPDLPVYGLAAQTGTAAEAARMCRQGGKSILAKALAPVRDEYKDVEVVTEVIMGRRTQVLLDASRSASVVVLATHRRHGRLGWHLGPVTHALLHHGHAPVLLVPVD
ncbi:universal stress protein [Yinghuangia sp. YIM S09857]|uniref:universal stress protein n=1 Tax=Yinghuangia sp. YIM S09857 TaxID=3436929 RepID=UPI003F53838B